MRKIENLSPLYRDSGTKAVNLTANASVRWSAVLLSLVLVSPWAQAVELSELRWFESVNGVELRLRLSRSLCCAKPREWSLGLRM